MDLLRAGGKELVPQNSELRWSQCELRAQVGYGLVCKRTVCIIRVAYYSLEYQYILLSYAYA